MYIITYVKQDYSFEIRHLDDRHSYCVVKDGYVTWLLSPQSPSRRVTLTVNAFCDCKRLILRTKSNGFVADVTTSQVLLLSSVKTAQSPKSVKPVAMAMVAGWTLPRAKISIHFTYHNTFQMCFGSDGNLKNVVCSIYVE